MKSSDKYRKMPYLSLWCCLCAALPVDILKKQGIENGDALEKMYSVFCSELNPNPVFLEKFNGRDFLKDYSQVQKTPVSDWLLVAEAMLDIFSENAKKKDSAILIKGMALSEILISTLNKEIRQSKNFLQKGKAKL